jgi:hypothetical protein
MGQLSVPQTHGFGKAGRSDSPMVGRHPDGDCRWADSIDPYGQSLLG